MGYSYLILDIVCLISSEQLNTRNLAHNLSSSQKKFVEGYNSIRTLTNDEIKLISLIEIMRWFILFGAWAVLIDEAGEFIMKDDITVETFFMTKLKRLLPHINILKAKWINNDYYYYNDLFEIIR
jgi:Ser/Thr protein kinase RdoA (MazF antagonist)